MSRYPFANEYPGRLTALQWAKKGCIPKHGAKGVECWTNRYCEKTAIYYCADDVEEASPEDLREYLRPIRERRNERRRLLRERKREMLRQLEEEQRRIEEKQRRYCDVMSLPPIPHEPIELIVFDTETTGLSEGINEIIQISIIDGNGNTLVNSLVKPYFEKEWPGAEAVNGISPDMVKDAPYPHELIPMVKGIFAAAGTIVAYNNDFDLGFLRSWGICVDGKKQVDVMREFAAVYGEWNDYFDDYKWQKLTTAAHYYGYDFAAHDSLEDARATLFVYRNMSVRTGE